MAAGSPLARVGPARPPAASPPGPSHHDHLNDCRRDRYTGHAGAGHAGAGTSGLDLWDGGNPAASRVRAHAVEET